VSSQLWRLRVHEEHRPLSTVDAPRTLPIPASAGALYLLDKPIVASRGLAEGRLKIDVD
jgi:hypothetical protein